MKIDNIKYSEYFTLEDKSEYDFAIKYAEAKDYYNVGDFTELSFGLIKDLQFDIQNGLQFDKYCDYFTQLTGIDLKDVYVIEFFGFQKYLISEIERIAEIENKSLSSEPTDEEYRAGVEVFEKYKSYPQFRAIMTTFGMTLQQVRDMKYSESLMELVYQKDVNDFQKRYTKIISKIQ
jgi:hypothetical protein